MKRIFFILPFIFLLSCGVQKRKYQKGFYVSNQKHKNHTQKSTDANQKKGTETGPLVLKTSSPRSEFIENDIISASAENKIALFTPSFSKQKTSNPDSLCDKITFKNGDEAMVKVLEIAPNDVKYKKCDSPDGPLYVVKKADVFMVTFANGTKEVFKTESTATQNNNNTQTTRNYDGPRKTHPMAILALVFAVLGLFTYGLFSIFSVIVARSAERKIRANPKIYKGETMARISRIVSTVLLSIIAGILLLAIILAILLV